MGHTGEVVENPENGHKQFYTCSLDGTVAFWDLRFKKDFASLDLTWRPFLRVPLSAMDNTFDYGLNKISIVPPVAAGKGVPMSTTQSSSTSSDKSGTRGTHHTSQSKFYCATEEGDLVYADWINEKSSEEKGIKSF